MSILKHKFELALRMIVECNANPHLLNPNGSNSMHILFANYSYDLTIAETLANKMIGMEIDINLVDNNGLTPIHVAVKKC